MDQQKLEQAVQLASKTNFVMIATSDRKGKPHISAAGELVKLKKGGHINVEEFFCPTTIANLEENNKISLVIWDIGRDQGYQLTGELCEPIEETMKMMNGYDPDMKQLDISQQEVKLHVHVISVMNFTVAPHTDQEL